jgi:hypothetical protein
MRYLVNVKRRPNGGKEWLVRSAISHRKPPSYTPRIIGGGDSSRATGFMKPETKNSRGGYRPSNRVLGMRTIALTTSISERLTVIPIIIPAFDEQDTIGEVVAAFNAHRASVEMCVYVVPDPETTDHTVERAMSAGAAILRSQEHGKGQGVNHAMRILHYLPEFVFCDGDISISPGAVSEMLMPLGRHTGQRIVVPRFPTATEWDEATTSAGLQFNPDAWPMVSGIRRVRRECVPDGLYGYLMETQINKAVAEAGYTTERAYSHDTISPLRFPPRRVADLFNHGRYGKETGIL